jgi:hypothetical protein
MSTFSFKKTIGRGVALALPLAIVGYVFYRITKIFEKVLGPLANKFGVEKILGELTLTFLAILVILAIIFLLGLLMQVDLIANLRKSIEALILKFVPSLNHLKLIAAEKIDLDNATHNWKPVLCTKGDEVFPAYVIDENAEWINLAVAKGLSTEPQNMLVVRRTAIRYKEITMKQMHDCNKAYGKGYISMVE